MDFTDLLSDLGSGLLYGLVGLALQALGFLLVDVLTPGKLGRQLAVDRNRNLGIIVASVQLATGLIVTSAILASDGDLGEGLAESAGFGLVGIVLLAIAYGLIELLTPGRLGRQVTAEGDEPLVYVTAASLLAVGGIVAAAIS